MSWKESALVLPHVCLGRTKDTAVLEKREKKHFHAIFLVSIVLVLPDAFLL